MNTPEEILGVFDYGQLRSRLSILSGVAKLKGGKEKKQSGGYPSLC